MTPSVSLTRRPTRVLRCRAVRRADTAPPTESACWGTRTGRSLATSRSKLRESRKPIEDVADSTEPSLPVMFSGYGPLLPSIMLPNLTTQRLSIDHVDAAHAPLLAEFFRRNDAHLARWEPPRPKGICTTDFWKPNARGRLMTTAAVWSPRRAVPRRRSVAGHWPHQLHANRPRAVSTVRPRLRHGRLDSSAAA